jgi:hypothetical protein
MNLASGDVKPVDWKLDHIRSGFCQCDEKLDIEGKPLLAETALDGLVAFAPYEFETALGIINWNACRYAYESRKETPAKMPKPGSLNGAAEDLATGAKQGIMCVLPVKDT